MCECVFETTSNPYKSIIVVAIKRDWHRTSRTGNNRMWGEEREDLMKKNFHSDNFSINGIRSSHFIIIFNVSYENKGWKRSRWRVQCNN